jgi:hypothetical protein
VDNADSNNPDLEKDSKIENGWHQSQRLRANEDSAYFSSSCDYDFISQTIKNCKHVFSSLEEAATLEDIDIIPYLPELKNLQQIKQCNDAIKNDWFKAIQEEVKFLIDNETFKRGETLSKDDEVIPAIFVYKAKVTTHGYLDKLKARCVACGDLQKKSDPEYLQRHSKHLFVKLFIANAQFNNLISLVPSAKEN